MTGDERARDDLDPGDALGFEIPAQSKPQKITVEFTSSETEVTAYLFK